MEIKILKIQNSLVMLEGCYKAMKSEDVIVKSEGTLHTSLIDNWTGITYCTWALPGGLPNLTMYIMYVFGQVI